MFLTPVPNLTSAEIETRLEKRWILFNVLVGGFGIACLFSLCYLIEDFGAFLIPPFFPLLTVVGFGMLANAAYFALPIPAFFNRYRFLIIAGFCMGVELLPCLAAGVYWAVTGERLASPYAHIVTVLPPAGALTGTYRLSAESIEYLDMPASVATKARMELLPGGIINVTSFPVHVKKPIYLLSNYSLIGGKGKYWLDDDGLYVRFLPVVDRHAKQTDISRIDDNYQIREKAGRYSIYITVGDPDSWNGIEWEKM